MNSVEGNKIEIRANKIIFSNGLIHEFPYKIEEVLPVYDVAIIILEIPPENSYNRNVFGFSNSGDFLWQIGEIDFFYDGKNCPYVGLYQNSNGNITLFNWCDTGVIIDPKSGEIIDKYMTR